MKKNMPFLMGAILLFMSSGLCGQNLTILENQLFDAEISYAMEKRNLDSLNTVLNNFVSRINDEKNRTDKNEELIGNLMATALPISMQVEDQEKTVNNKAVIVKSLRKKLYKKYTVLLDSLTKQSKENDEVIAELQTKRLKVLPMLPLFSFNPALINRIENNGSENDVEKNVYDDYLRQAIKEVDSNLVAVQTQSADVRDAIKLGSRAEDFLDEIENAQMFGMASVQSENLTFENEPSELYDGDRFTNLNGIKAIYSQLQPVLKENIEMPDFYRNDSLAIEDYLILLEDTEKTLKLYRKLIEQKLDE